VDDLAVHRIVPVAVALIAPSRAFAHAGHGAESNVEQSAFIILIVTVVFGACFYTKGVAALWRKAGAGHGIRRGQTVKFALGWVVLAGSLLPPVDAWAERSFAMHMTQHELLMVVAAPLIVLGRPLEAWTWAMPARARRLLAAAGNTTVLRAVGYVATLSLGAWVLHALALWIWHVPMLFQAALLHPVVHILQHGCFLGSAVAYWWTVIGGRAQKPSPSSIASLFTTMLHTSALGALLTFAPSPWYVIDGARSFGLSALEEQQLGGLIMWVPGGMAYLVVGLKVVGRWLASPHTVART